MASAAPGSKEERYDRQLRIWGDHGQKRLENARVCLLNASATGAEILKSLVLPGVGSFTIVDDHQVIESDVDTNFFVDVDSIGKSKAEIVCNYLKELNPEVRGNFVVANVDRLVENGLHIFDEFNVVIGTDLCEKVAMEIGDYLWSRRTPFVICKSYGLLGYVRLVAPELYVIESHPDNPPLNFCLDRPYPKLQSYVDSIDLDALDHEKHSHIPYLVLLMKALQKWSTSNGVDLPRSYKEKNEIKQVLLSMRKPDEKGNLEEENFREAVNNVVRALAPSTMPETCKKIFAHPKCSTIQPESSPFWIICNALKRFVEERDGALPVRGDLPDMIADSDCYVILQNIFHESAEEDAKIVQKYVVETLHNVGLAPDSISYAEVRAFSKNAAFLRVIDGKSLRAEFREGESGKFVEIQESGDDRLALLKWYVALRATESFYAQKARYPGTNGIPVELDKNDLKCRVENFLKVHGMNALEMENEIAEMCRYGAAEIHVTAAYIGGIVAQEVVKLITKQFVPLNNTFIYDGNTGNAGFFEM